MKPQTRVPLAATTSGKPEDTLVARAREAAREWNLSFFPRRRKEPIHPLLESAAEAFIVFEREGVSLWD